MFHFIFLLPVLKREKGGKGKAEPLKPIFLLISMRGKPLKHVGEGTQMKIYDQKGRVSSAEKPYGRDEIIFFNCPKAYC